ncbi:(2,3-dihydroxybenzoyl)adenylate synthase [Dickeya solani]|uniref:AMP-binding protein n=1 Tax=Dickeya solani TaxID=1089444 RepID=A0AAX4EXB9_9GAMM|nr:AMP-binding protein [Dickeya solani]WOA52085.1 AMP-binding protein [Dickeya solani]
MSEPIAEPDHRILPEDMRWPTALAERYTQRGYWQPTTLGQLILQWREYGERTALIEPGHSWSYYQLINQACRFASELRQRGMRTGETAVIQLPNGADFVVAFFAVILNGAVPVLMLPAHRQREILHVVELAQAHWFLSDAEQTGIDEQSLRANAPDCHSLFSTAAQRFAASQTPAIDGLPPGDAPHHIALLLLSGGTTGLPKLIPRTHADYHYNFRASAALCHVQPDDRYLAVLSMAHNFPLACPGILGIFSRGGCMVVPTTVAAEDAFDAIRQHRVTLTALVPSLATLWLEAAEWEQPDLSSLRLVQVGGARLGPDAARKLLDQWGCQLQQVFGMAEGLLNYTRLDDSRELITTTQGRPLCDDDEIRVVDEQGHAVVSGQAGELLVRGPYTIRGYYRAPEHNRKAFAAEGFYRSGDRVRQLPGGELLVEGRTRDMINRHGESVAADEIEECLRAHPLVRDVTVLADSVGEQQEAIHAVVIAYTPFTLAEMRAFLEQQQVASFKWPDRLTLIDAFPLTPIGKINKHALAARLAV